jgi:methionyl-tRNA formyltransferase
MRLHVFATDVSCMELLDQLSEDEVTAVVIPSNRGESLKVDLLRKEAEQRGFLVSTHERGKPVDPLLPPADAGISWLYSQIILASDIEKYPSGLLNMHGGVIPSYRGASVLHWAIINGEDEMGITWHEIVEAVDAGPIWAESRIPIPQDATALDMRGRMIQEGLRLFPEAWAAFKTRSPSPRYADVSSGQVWPQRRPSDGVIEQGWSERRVRDIVRALCPPWPPATFATGETTFKIARADDSASPGAIAYETAEGTTLYLIPVPEEDSLDRRGKS